MANPGFRHNHGKIGRLYPDANRLYFRFRNGAGSEQAMIDPATQYYFISADVKNYEAMARLVYLCAEKDWELQVQTKPTLTGGEAEVEYIVLDKPT
jgi:hypothetical protein